MNEAYYKSGNLAENGGEDNMLTVSNTRKSYITPQERKEKQRQILKKFYFELLLKQNEKEKNKK